MKNLKIHLGRGKINYVKREKPICTILNAIMGGGATDKFIWQL